MNAEKNVEYLKLKTKSAFCKNLIKKRNSLNRLTSFVSSELYTKTQKQSKIMV